MIPIQCGQCGGRAQIEAAWSGREVECPHCHRPTLAVEAKPPSTTPPPPPPPQSPPPFAGEPRITIKANVEPAPTATVPATTPKRPPLTRVEREAIRRRRHLIFALGGGLILLITAAVLIALNGTPIE